MFNISRITYIKRTNRGNKFSINIVKIDYTSMNTIGVKHKQPLNVDFS